MAGKPGRPKGSWSKDTFSLKLMAETKNWRYFDDYLEAIENILDPAQKAAEIRQFMTFIHPKPKIELNITKEEPQEKAKELLEAYRKLRDERNIIEVEAIPAQNKTGE